MARIIVKNLNSLETDSKQLANLTLDEATTIHGGMPVDEEGKPLPRTPDPIPVCPPHQPCPTPF
jgi:hypothetical protein